MGPFMIFGNGMVSMQEYIFLEYFQLLEYRRSHWFYCLSFFCCAFIQSLFEPVPAAL